RAGTTTPFWWGSSIIPKQANYSGDGAMGESRRRTVPVDSFEPNPWGLYNVHGNVQEWTEDCWIDSNMGNPGDGRARTAGDCSKRVLRGGSWYGYAEFLRSAYRFGGSVKAPRLSAQGFRLARALVKDTEPTPSPKNSDDAKSSSPIVPPSPNRISFS